MAFKKPSLIIAEVNDTSASCINMIKDLFTQFATGFNNYCGSYAEAIVKDRIINGVRVVDLFFTNPNTNFCWVYSANEDSDDWCTIYISHVNKTNDNLIVNLTSYQVYRHYLYFDGYTNYRNLLSVICSENSFIVSLILGDNSLYNTEKTVFAYANVFGICKTNNDNYVLTFDTRMNGYLAGDATPLTCTIPQIISHKNGACVVRKCMYPNNEILTDISLLNSDKQGQQISDWYLYLKNSGIYYCFGYGNNAPVAICRINEDARSVR